MKEIVKAIYDIAKEKDVDLGVATAMYHNEHKEVDVKPAENFIKDNYNKLCDAYNSENSEDFDNLFPAE